MNARATPSLRIARLVVENFRTFHGPTEIPLAGGDVADELAVFHGENGTGKSNALAALELFFRAALHWLHRWSPANEGSETRLKWNERDGGTGLLVSHRDWPPGVREPLRVDVFFAEGGVRRTVVLIPAGNTCTLGAEGLWEPREPEPASPEEAERLIGAALSRLETPLGPGSIPYYRLDARRRAHLPTTEEPFIGSPAGPVSAELATRLLGLATSFEPLDTERWRAFIKLVSRFKTLQGREVNVLRMPDGTVDLRFEIRGKQILRVSELSSGEQQVVALCAAVLTSRAAIVAIEEPEISLHPDYQVLVRDVLREQVQDGLIDQIILESHVPVFDGPEVIRFGRTPEGATSVTRQASDASDEQRARARKSGAEEQWVTPEGYTKLPDEMRQTLGLQNGGHLWFLPSKPQGRWQAWTAAELDRMLGLPGDKSGS